MTRGEWALAVALFALDIAAMILVTLPRFPTPVKRRPFSDRLRLLHRCALCLENTDEILRPIGREWAHYSCVAEVLEESIEAVGPVPRMWSESE